MGFLSILSAVVADCENNCCVALLPTLINLMLSCVSSAAMCPHTKISSLSCLPCTLSADSTCGLQGNNLDNYPNHSGSLASSLSSSASPLGSYANTSCSSSILMAFSAGDPTVSLSLLPWVILCKFFYYHIQFFCFKYYCFQY